MVDGSGLLERSVGVDVQEGVDAGVDRRDAVEVRLGDLDGAGLAGATTAASSAAVEVVRSVPCSLLVQDARNAEAAVLGRRCAVEHGLAVERGR